jgi:hypothetical protein
LAFPKFDKEHARQAVDNRIGDGKVAQQEPAAEAEDGREDKKDKVRLEEGEIEADLLPESVANLVEITGSKERFLTPILDQLFVRGFVVQREDGFYMLPLSILGCYPGTSFTLWQGDHIVDCSQAFCIRYSIAQRLTVRVRLFMADTIQPVSDPTSTELAEVKPVLSEQSHLDLWIAF